MMRLLHTIGKQTSKTHRETGKQTTGKHHMETDHQNTHMNELSPLERRILLCIPLLLCTSQGAVCEEGVQGVQLCHLLTVHKACNVPQDDQLFAVAVQAHCYQEAAIWRQVQAVDAPSMPYSRSIK